MKRAPTFNRPLPEIKNTDPSDIPSKSAIKREMLALKSAGVRLVNLKTALLDTLPLFPKLRYAIDEGKRIKSHNAMKRHLGFVGKLLQQQDMTPIYALFDYLDHQGKAYNEYFHQLEQWRDRLISADKAALTEYIKQHPNADRQYLCQLIRQGKKELEQGSAHPIIAARKLFKYLKEFSLFEQNSSA